MNNNGPFKTVNRNESKRNRSRRPFLISLALGTPKSSTSFASPKYCFVRKISICSSSRFSTLSNGRTTKFSRFPSVKTGKRLGSSCEEYSWFRSWNFTGYLLISRFGRGGMSMLSMFTSCSRSTAKRRSASTGRQTDCSLRARQSTQPPRRFSGGVSRKRMCPLMTRGNLRMENARIQFENASFSQSINPSIDRIH